MRDEYDDREPVYQLNFSNHERDKYVPPALGLPPKGYLQGAAPTATLRVPSLRARGAP
jgi:hypothetical protein